MRHALASDVVVHVHTSGENGIFANAYLVETDAGVVAVDATLTESESKALRAEVDALRKPLLFLGDMVFNGTHAYTADGHVLAWLANLARLERICEGMATAFPGHGAPDEPQALVRRQRDYLLAFASYVKELADGKLSLTEDAKAAISARMNARYPQNGLDFLISLGADALARELNGEC